MKAGEQREERKMANSWNQVTGMMNSPRWRSLSIRRNLKRGKKKDVEGLEGRVGFG